MAWLLAVLAGGCNAGTALAGKAAERSHCRPAAYGLVVFVVAGLTALTTTLGSEAAWGDWRLWAFGGAMGALYLVAIAAALRANRCWPPSIVWASANMAFVAPILLSALFLGEPLRGMDALIAAGVALMLAGLAEPASSRGSRADAEDGHPTPGARWALLGAVFAANGLLMLGYKLFGVALPDQPSASLVAATYGCGALLAVAVQASRGAPRVSRAELGWGTLAGAATSLAALALLGAMQLPAAVAFPVVQGTSLAGGVFLCALVFRERLTPRKLAALAVGLGTMALTLWR
jgi:multidrug transporter EmrE-like cation transporter